MRKNVSGFTLVELLVVITILAIISITAYTNFSGSTDKAKNSTKLGHIANIETGLNAFYVDNNYYPMPSQYSATNVWGYSGVVAASTNNTLAITSANNQISALSSGSGGGQVFLSGVATQIGAKGTMDKDVLGKQYLSQELADPSIRDIKVANDKVMKDYGVGEYIYATYAKNNTDWTATSKKSTAYNLAASYKDEQKGYITKITGNFDKSTCVNCPASLIGSGSANNNLTDGESTLTGSYTDANNRTAYPVEF